jgi:uncharacterized membrane protein
MFLSTKHHLAIFREHKQRALESGLPPILNPNEVHEEFKARLGVNGKVATVLTGIYGSMWFVYFLVLITAGWMLLQSFLSKKAFDPYPYAFLLFCGNLIQLVGGPIIQVGQNLSSAHSELRAEADYEVNKKSFADIEAMQARLEKLELENHELLQWLKEHTVSPQPIKGSRPKSQS